MFIFFKKEKEKESMKKTNIKYLKDFKDDMVTALFYNYTRQIPSSALREIDRIYTEETGKNLRTNFACSSCVLRLMRQTAIIYFKDFLDELPEELQDKYKEKYIKE